MYAIGLCLDNNYLLPGLVTLMSAANAIPPRDRKSVAIRVITNDLTRPHGDAIAAFSSALGFGSFDLEWRGLHEKYRVVKGGAYITATTYLRFDFSPEFVRRPHLIYLDCDLLILDDISSPFNYLDGSQLGAVRGEFNSTIGECAALPGLVDDFPAVRGRPYFNAGALWLETSLMPSVKNGVVNILRGHRKRYIRFNDQDAMNLWLIGWGQAVQLPGHLNRFEIGRFLELGEEWTMRTISNGPRDASVLHFIGQLKPWLRRCPVTPGVRSYRIQLAESRRLLQKLRIQTICLKDD